MVSPSWNHCCLHSHFLSGFLRLFVECCLKLAHTKHNVLGLYRLHAPPYLHSLWECRTSHPSAGWLPWEPERIANKVEKLEAGAPKAKQFLKVEQLNQKKKTPILKDTAAENCWKNVLYGLSGVEWCVLCGWCASNLWNIVDMQVAALFDGLLIAGRLSRLGGLSNKGGGL